jgi:acetyltransferase-like isoleucine patch superfamily enzyme
MSIGKWTIIGAGSVVINHILDFQKVVGVPAKFIKLK